VTIPSASRLAALLLGDLEQIVERTAARIQQLLPAYERVSREDLIPVLLADTRHILEAICDADAERGREAIDDRARARAQARARQEVSGDELLQGWRVGLESSASRRMRAAASSGSATACCSSSSKPR
jgi:hypothetical protein